MRSVGIFQYENQSKYKVSTDIAVIAVRNMHSEGFSSTKPAEIHSQYGYCSTKYQSVGIFQYPNQSKYAVSTDIAVRNMPRVEIFQHENQSKYAVSMDVAVRYIQSV